MLEGINEERIMETWKIHRVGGISQKINLVVLLNDGTHLCTCMETITKGIICRHFWRVMLYSSVAKFHISIIPTRWYKDDILMKVNNLLEKSPILTAVELTTPHEVNFTLESLKHIQEPGHLENFQIVPQRNKFGIAFSTAKTAINIALETKSDNELVRLLKNFISSKKNRNDLGEDTAIENDENNDSSEILPLQEHLITQTTDPHVTRIRGAPSKKRMKGVIEQKGKKVLREVTNNNITEEVEGSSRCQRRCHMCGVLGHYQKKCPNAKNRTV